MTRLRDIPSGWGLEHIGELAQVARGSSPRPAGDPRYFAGDCMPWITVAEVTKNGSMYLDQTQTMLTREGARRSRTIPSGTLILTNSGATLGVPKITRITACANDGIAVFLRPVPGLDIRFLYYALGSLTRYLRESLAPGIGQPNLNTELIGGVTVPLPPLPEQRKIAEILFTWDRAVEQTQKLIEAKERLKRGLMQQLLRGSLRFPQFGKQPAGTRETRFGAVPSDWPYVPVSTFAREVTDRHDGESDIPVLSCTKYDGLVDSLAYFGRRVFSEETSGYKVVRRGQFAYATNHIEEGSIGLLGGIDAGLVSPIYTVFEVDSDRVHAPFLYSLLKTELYRHIFEINTSASVDRRGSLRWSQFRSIRVALPGLEEQRAISACSTTAEREVAVLRKQLSALQRQKVGLMQKLLTGKVRVRPRSSLRVTDARVKPSTPSATT